MKIGFPVKDPGYYGHEWVATEMYAQTGDKKFGSFLKDDLTVKIDIEPHLDFIEKVVATDTFPVREGILNQILATTIDPYLQLAAMLQTMTLRSAKERTRKLEYTNNDISHKMLVDAVHCIGFSETDMLLARRGRENYQDPIQFMGGEIHNYRSFTGTASFSEAVLEVEDLWGKVGNKVSSDISEKVRWRGLPILSTELPERWKKEYLQNTSRGLAHSKNLTTLPGGIVIKDFEHSFRTDILAGRIGEPNDFLRGNPEQIFTSDTYYSKLQNSSRGLYKRLSPTCPLSTFVLSLPPGVPAEQIAADYDVHVASATFIHEFSSTRSREHKDIIESIKYVDLNISKYLLSMPGFIGSMQDMMLVYALRTAIYLEYMDDNADSNESALHALMRKRDEMVVPIHDKEWNQGHSYDNYYVENGYSKMSAESLKELSLHSPHSHGGKLWNYEKDYSLQPMKRLQAG